MTKIVLAVLIALFISLPLRPVAAQQHNCALPEQLLVGYQGRVTPGDDNRVRSDSSTSAEIIGVIPAGGVFTVLQMSRCQDGYRWWQVDYEGLVGWTVEGDAGVYWLEPLLPDLPAMPVLPELAPTVELPVDEAARTITLSPAGNVLAVEGDGQIIRYGLPEFTTTDPLTFTGNYVKGISFSDETARLLACVNDRELEYSPSVTFWSLYESTAGMILYDEFDKVCEQTLFYEDQRLFVAQDGIYALEGGGELTTFISFEHAFWGDSIAVFGAHVALHIPNGQYYLYDLTALNQAPHMLENPAEDRFINFGRAPLALTPAGDRFARRAGTMMSAVEIYAVGDTLDLVTTLQSDSPVTGLALNADGSLLASGHLNGSVYLWDVANSTPIALLPAGSTLGTALAFNLTEPTLYTLAQDHVLRAWDISALE